MVECAAENQPFQRSNVLTIRPAMEYSYTAMADRPHNPDPRRFRRSLAGQALVRRRPPPRVVRGATPPPKVAGKLLTRLLLGLALVSALLIVAGARGVYVAYAHLGTSRGDGREELPNLAGVQSPRL